MKKLLTLCSQGTKGAIKANGPGNRYVIEKEYSDTLYDQIRKEADRYEIYVYSSWGYDYGYGTESSSTKESSERIEDTQIVVSYDGLRFVGVAGSSNYYEFNKISHTDNGFNVTLITDPVDRWKGYPLILKNGDSFSSDDHERWNYSYYYLRKKNRR